MRAQQGIVRQIKEKARIVVIIMYPTDARNFLVTCYDEGMLNGDYVYMSNDVIHVTGFDFVYRPEVGE